MFSKRPIRDRKLIAVKRNEKGRLLRRRWRLSREVESLNCCDDGDAKFEMMNVASSSGVGRYGMVAEVVPNFD